LCVWETGDGEEEAEIGMRETGTARISSMTPATTTTDDADEYTSFTLVIIILSLTVG
jgi:hypothetical protein